MNLVSSDLILTIAEKGAEMVSLKTKDGRIEFIWQGNSDSWNGHAPLLFPAVGDWKDNIYLYKGNKYEMPRHGFAQVHPFKMSYEHEGIKCILSSNEETKKYYPFEFELDIFYRLIKNKLYITQKVKNLSSDDMPFSIGEHVGFNIPLVENGKIEDYYLQFDQKETAERYPLIDGRTIGSAIPCLEDESIIQLDSNMFTGGAWNFKNLVSDSITLKSKQSSHNICVEYPGFSYFSIWSIPGAPFLCIEPCNGIAASDNEGYDPYKKEGIHILKPQEQSRFFYSISINGL